MAPLPLDVMVVEDHADTRKYLQLYLKMAGHRVRTAGSVGEAVKLLNSAGCNVLISDIGLPDGNGWELLDLLSGNPPDFAVAMSGFGSESDRQKSLEKGFREHFTKPFDLMKLEGLLQQAASELS